MYSVLMPDKIKRRFDETSETTCCWSEALSYLILSMLSVLADVINVSVYQSPREVTMSAMNRKAAGIAKPTVFGGDRKGFSPGRVRRIPGVANRVKVPRPPLPPPKTLVSWMPQKWNRGAHHA